MHKTIAEAEQPRSSSFCRRPSSRASVQIVVCPPFTALAAVAGALKHAHRLGRADYARGASRAHLPARSAGRCCANSAWRTSSSAIANAAQYFCETDEAVNRKVRYRAGIRAGADRRSRRDAPKNTRPAAPTNASSSQTRAAFDGIPADDLAPCVVAYEPIWAIGTGRTCTPESANGVMAAIRACARRPRPRAASSTAAA